MEATEPVYMKCASGFLLLWKLMGIHLRTKFALRIQNLRV